MRLLCPTNTRTLAAVLFFSSYVAGCGMGVMQTAKTTEKGSVDITLGGGYLYNEMVENRGVAITNIPPYVGARFGVTNHMDLGASLFLGGGASVDTKYNFFGHGNPMALSIQAGASLAKDWFGSQSTIFMIPIHLLASYSLAGGFITPYLGLGYNDVWIFGYQGDYNPQPGDKLADRAGYGDGLLQISVGLELFSNRRVQLLMEYDCYYPLVDDPGDRFSFVTNHLFMAAARF